jgi:hypothetical protein
MGEGRETVESLGRELQSLPIASAAPALLLALLGVVLLVSGRHLLRPVLVVALLALGATVGGTILGGWLPAIAGLPAALLGAVAGVVLAAVAWRVLYGVATGAVGGFAAALLALVVVHAGFIDARTPEGATPPAGEHEVIRLDEVAEREAIVDAAPAAIRPLVAWSLEHWHAEEPQVRTLLLAAAGAGLFIGFAIGLWLPQQAAAALTSLTGSLFALLGGMPLAAAATGRAPSEVAPIGWLLLWLALAAAGWIVQSWREPRAARSAAASTAPAARE